jgi:hypothetical protein
MRDIHIHRGVPPLYPAGFRTLPLSAQGEATHA